LIDVNDNRQRPRDPVSYRRSRTSTEGHGYQ
jgi:hypothetical protein